MKRIIWIVFIDGFILLQLSATHATDTLNNDVACGDFRPDVKINPGQIQAPQYDNGSYVHHQNCHWLLQASQGHVVGLDFLLVDLSTTFPCVYSNITVYDGDTPNKDDVILQLCGNHDVTPHVFSSWHVMLVVFQTGHQGQGMGFTADFDFTAVTETACNPSSQPAVLDWSLGGFVSPNWPNPYPANQYCSWIIRTNVYRDLRLEFVQFHLEDSSQSYCSNDNVTIHDGSAPGDTPIGVFCGDHAPDPSGITQTDMLVTFKSDSSGQFGGFQARFREYNTTAYACSESNPVKIDWSPGNLYSPETEESSCTWRFTAAVGKVVRFDIVYYDLPDCHLCSCASLQIFDGENEYAPSLGTYCRDGWGNFPLITGGNTAFCIYSSYLIYEHAGFQIHFSFYDPSEEACGPDKPIVLTHPEGVIASPNFGKGDYPPNADCQWKIIARLGQVIRMEFWDLDIEYCPYGCSCDSLSIYNGDSTSSTRIGRYCGSQPPLSIYTTVASTYLVFQTDAYVEDRGFRITYAFRLLSDLACTLSSPAEMMYTPGDILSPNYGNGHYPPFSDCEWLIRSPYDDNKVVVLGFVDFGVEASNNCESDYLAIYDGMDDDAKLLAKFCGHGLPPTVTSSGYVLFLRFRSDFSIEAKGFHAQYEFKDAQTAWSMRVLPAIVIACVVIVLFFILCIYCKAGRKWRRLKLKCRHWCKCCPCVRPIDPEEDRDERDSIEPDIEFIPDDTIPADIALQLAEQLDIMHPPSYTESNRLPTYAPPSYDEAMENSTDNLHPPANGELGTATERLPPDGGEDAAVVIEESRDVRTGAAIQNTANDQTAEASVRRPENSTGTDPKSGDSVDKSTGTIPAVENSTKTGGAVDNPAYIHSMENIGSVNHTVIPRGSQEGENIYDEIRHLPPIPGQSAESPFRGQSSRSVPSTEQLPPTRWRSMGTLPSPPASSADEQYCQGRLRLGGRCVSMDTMV